MKNILILLIFIALNLNGYSQTIVDFFETVPSSSLHKLTEEQRKEIVKYSINNKSEEDAYSVMRNNKINYAFDIIDLRNGYLRLIGPFEGHIQMCFWNLTNGNKLIAIYEEGCGPVCYIVQFDFYEYNGKDFIPIKWQNIIPDIYQFFFQDLASNIEEMKQKDILATLLFELPRNGKNIVAKWGNEDTQETYKKYGVGDRMNLIWNDGKFTKGDIYWK
ncbi:MAG TPA: hypothetical protein VLZ33_02710 [Dysgonamonadaceae bacterium]|nr:hypothetical protein [Dysgonamonadaceae bacterium]